MTEGELFQRFLKVLADNTDGEWEHSGCFMISAMDNPGWHTKIGLEGFARPIQVDSFNFDGMDAIDESKPWFACKWIGEEVLECFGDQMRLPYMLLVSLHAMGLSSEEEFSTWGPILATQGQEVIDAHLLRCGNDLGWEAG